MCQLNLVFLRIPIFGKSQPQQRGTVDNTEENFISKGVSIKTTDYSCTSTLCQTYRFIAFDTYVCVPQTRHLNLPRLAMSALDSKAAFAERMGQLGVEDELKGELQGKGFETFGSLAFAVSTTPQQITDAVLDTWLSKVTNRDLSPYQTSCIRRLVVESHALALNDLQRKVDQPSDPQLATRKLPMAERQTRQLDQEARLEGIMFSPEVTPSHALVDLCVNMLERNVLTWIKPEECTSRSQEIQSLKRDAKVSLDANGSIKICSKAASTT